MMIMKKVLLISIVLCLFFAGCSNDEVETVGDQTQRNSFIEQTIPGIYNGDVSGRYASNGLYYR